MCCFKNTNLLKADLSLTLFHQEGTAHSLFTFLSDAKFRSEGSSFPESPSSVFSLQKYDEGRYDGKSGKRNV